MTPVRTFRGKTVALFGLGGSGLSTAKALMAGGANVRAWDDGEAGRLAAARNGVPLEDLSDSDWSSFAALVLSPGVPLTHPEPHWTVARARAAGVEVIGDIELFCRERAAHAGGAPFIAITGTNGKSTTTALIAHILHEAGRDVQLGGNIGVPILDLEPPSDERIHVIECSSFQIDLTPSLNPTIGILINLTPDHIDRHGTMENYAAVKECLVAGAEVALVGVDDAYTHAIGARLSANAKPEQRIMPVSAARPLDWGFYVEDGGVYFREQGHPPEEAELLGSLQGARALRGAHNAQNAAFAAAAAWECGLEDEEIARGLLSYPGLPHRMEEVGRIDRTLFVNDSKATNADAAEKALASFADIYWIIGGKAKEGGIEPLRPYFPRIRKAYLIGHASDDFARTLDGALPYERCETLDVATMRAAFDALDGDAAEPIVLLSPACASYDQFKNFEARGDAFRALVNGLPAVIAARRGEHP
ncbi:UDP-N-acetylmuramoyl-L-alanine--D-glutamate ligase [Methylocystis sp. MJC1]|jgi:UDP-N-acetylmuramoylalanine--D-glutamate ligase|uniref:UDP-N-acetylmuramoyl-L-alanine--D-glutamate ligase n=1 Tax=Methylocystis sp. MJC1 TaxID=2654282 RepID=UPI0013EBB5CD|nr:UDP-N-acetylmuramoyl-L-alanine--D-glutamate ligase [Methylocystis sp. MJC1]KAF2989480.1 UDP-N-acetylmuramoylalanine--D-glutamate ligase [Methylocystis sp. MJC1]MBU6527930.1 UDP-N-acetylmuramoyl-L-alanine--D-glutamate ligase [Methylocystis sp. MJC1]UZX10850.1 UDP-N-acetylmuramoyl-L-alanine--D-glutamate ligase [Methylocystis sp. MJC1]